jgi:hypothetical protein
VNVVDGVVSLHPANPPAKALSIARFIFVADSEHSTVSTFKMPPDVHLTVSPANVSGNSARSIISLITAAVRLHVVVIDPCTSMSTTDIKLLPLKS